MKLDFALFVASVDVHEHTVTLLPIRVGRTLMLNFLPIMLFQYAQNRTDYAYNYLPIMLKLCPLFLEGANLYAQIFTVQEKSTKCTQASKEYTQF